MAKKAYDPDTEFLCKDCTQFNACKYYDRRKPCSYICKYFHLTWHGMTNGDFIKTMFPNEDLFVETDNYVCYGPMRFEKEWWDSEFKRCWCEEGRK